MTATLRRSAQAHTRSYCKGTQSELLQGRAAARRKVALLAPRARDESKAPGARFLSMHRRTAARAQRATHKEGLWAYTVSAHTRQRAAQPARQRTGALLKATYTAACGGAGANSGRTPFRMLLSRV